MFYKAPLQRAELPRGGLSKGGLALAGGPSPTQHPGTKGVALSPVLANPVYCKYLESLIIWETLWNNYILIFFS